MEQAPVQVVTSQQAGQQLCMVLLDSQYQTTTYKQLKWLQH